ncbi:MAG: hypothetical protein HYW64_01005, partial [Candidatus Levybacteria bacterium]|nr:hypothetical protein [Candidatus Levybacteria bacterium]
MPTKKIQPIDEIIGSPRASGDARHSEAGSPEAVVEPQVFQAPLVPTALSAVPASNAVPTEEVAGILDIQPEGHGFLRPKFLPSSRDIYIS